MGAVLSDERTIRDKVCIIGIGETEFTKAGGIERPEFRLALEAITAACDDAGLEIDQLNGFSSYADDRNTGVRVANALGIPQFNFTSRVGGGGGVAPTRFGRALFDAAGEPKGGLFPAQAGHNDLYDHGAAEAVIEFLKRLYR